MTRSRIRSRIAALAATLIVLGGCSSAPSASPSGTAQPFATAPASAGAPVIAPPLADILSYKAGADRLGVHPGPGPAAQPVPMWHMDLPSGLVAAPLIADGMVVVASEDGSVRAFDGNTGAPAWTAEFPSGLTVTPTIADGTLYAITVDGTLRTMSLADRSLGWTAEGFLPDSQTNVAGDLLLAGAPGALVALGRADGKERCRAEAAGSGRTGIDATNVYVSGTGSGVLQALALADGKRGWTLETASATVLTPSVTGGTVYVAARDVAGGRNVTYAIGPDGKELWHAADPSIPGSASVTTDRVYRSFDEPKTGVEALDRSNGKVVWRRELTGHVLGLLVAADGALYLITTEDGLVSIDAISGEIRWRAEIDDAVNDQLAVSGGLIFIGQKFQDGSGQIVAFAAPNDPRFGSAASPVPPAATEAPP
jgi:outer membrane protein assembly factor BamB